MTEEQLDRRETERRQGERRSLGWRSKWQGVVAVLAAVGSLMMPTYDFLQKQAALKYQFELDLKKAEIELLRKQLAEPPK